MAWFGSVILDALVPDGNPLLERIPVDRGQKLLDLFLDRDEESDVVRRPPCVHLRVLPGSLIGVGPEIDDHGP